MSPDLGMLVQGYLHPKKPKAVRRSVAPVEPRKPREPRVVVTVDVAPLDYAIAEHVTRGAERFGLTPQMTAVALEMAKGLQERQIASRFGLSENTIKYHVRHIFRRTKTSARSLAVARLIAAGMQS